MGCSFDEFCQWRDKLVAGGKPIIVEGKKDLAALRSIGVTNQIFLLNKKPLFAVVEDVVSVAKDVVILTDLDDEGKMLYSRLRHDLGRFGVRIDRKFREFLFKETRLRQIEGLRSYSANL
ncbi:MAG: toprim domain-containing protein [Candidatus Woesearchaeota archaeon]